MSGPVYSFHALHFIVRYGGWLAWLVTIAVAAAGVVAWAAGLPASLLIAGAVGGAFAYLVVRSYVELVRVIVDMLLPK